MSYSQDWVEFEQGGRRLWLVSSANGKVHLEFILVVKELGEGHGLTRRMPSHADLVQSNYWKSTRYGKSYKEGSG